VIRLNLTQGYPDPMPHATFHPLHPALPDDLIDALLAEHRAGLPRLQRLWDYYRNPTPAPGSSPAPAPGSSAPAPGSSPTFGSSPALGHAHSSGGTGLGRPAQARGLPPRLRDARADAAERELVIENDIAWRIDTLVEFAFGSPPTIHSLAGDESKRHAIEALLRDTFATAGGIAFYHDLALLGGIYGRVETLVTYDRHARSLRLEPIEAPRLTPLLRGDDYRILDAVILDHEQATNQVQSSSLLGRWRGRLRGRDTPDTKQRRRLRRIDVWTAQRCDRYVETGGALGGVKRKHVASHPNPLGRIPVVHIQNAPQPYRFDGLSDVEPLIPLQDELNTRLSDRANRITFQSFKMFLGVGIEDFHERPIGPGQMWASDNPDARIETFGGDAHNPSEEAHITQVREAMDKASSVTPVAAGLLGGKVGNLTSENALRIVLMGLLARTRRKRTSYGRGIEQLCELILHAAAVHGLLETRPEDRRVRLDWPDPLPDADSRRLHDALLKQKLGVPSRHLLAELGYAECEQ